MGLGMTRRLIAQDMVMNAAAKDKLFPNTSHCSSMSSTCCDPAFGMLCLVPSWFLSQVRIPEGLSNFLDYKWEVYSTTKLQYHVHLILRIYS